MKKLIVLLVFVCARVLNAQAQSSLVLSASQQAEIKKFQVKVEANPTNLEAHRAFIEAFKMNDHPMLEAQYKSWVKQFPMVFTVPFAISEYYVHREIPKATPFLLRASILKPDNAEVWSLLASDAYLRNDIKARQEYLKKAIQYDPKNADYTFYYAESFEKTDTLMHDSLALEVVRRFPDSERAAQSLFWLAYNAPIQAEKVAYYKQLYNRKSNENFNWYLSGVQEYFDILLKTKPDEAFELGLNLTIEGKRNRNLWKDRIKVADAFLKARKLLSENQPAQALVILDQVNLGNANQDPIRAKEYLALFKAEAADAAGKTHLAFDSLAVLYSRNPTENVQAAILKYGAKLNMDSSSIAKSIWKIRNSRAMQAVNFSLDNYSSSTKTNLSDYQGKVVLMTYWFPGCGPCRNEFPHFESVLKKFSKNEIVYIGLNLEPLQDSAVLPFLRESGYSFIPLHDNWARNKGNLPAPGAPTNYLIDQKGRIIFSGFMISKETEKTLELMIKETLAAKD